MLHRALDGMSDEVLAFRPAEHMNPIGWLAWHIGRVEDMHPRANAVAADRFELVTSCGVALGGDDKQFLRLVFIHCVPLPPVVER